MGGDGLSVSLEKLEEIIGNFRVELRRGLASEGAMLKALPTFISRLATGRERGDFLVIDLGGSNLRVGCVVLRGDGTFALDRTKWSLPDELRHAKGVVLFDFIAECVRTYLEGCPHDSLRVALDGKPCDLGFTFSYPVRQERLAHGVLIQWNKALACNDVIGLDVVRLLEEALQRKDLGNIRVKALLNDTVGTLVAQAYADADTRIGVILGTGTNAAYVESTSMLSKLGSSIQNEKEMVINVEWGAFGEGKPEYLPLTEVDRSVDAETVNPGKQPFEKMISGMYLGEVARRCLLDADGGQRITAAAFALDTADLSAMEASDGECKKIMCQKLQWTDPTPLEVTRTRDICRGIVQRSARLCAAGIVALYRAIGAPKHRTVVAFDGSLYQYYPGYPRFLRGTLDELQPGHSMELQLAKDASMVGAAAVLARHA